MELEVIVDGVKELMRENHYSSSTIKTYEGPWNKLKTYLVERFGNTEFTLERGLDYLEKEYGILTNNEKNCLSQSQIQKLRTIHVLEDYRLHGVLTRRFYGLKGPRQLSDDDYLSLYRQYTKSLSESDLSNSTIGHYTKISLEFCDFLIQRKVLPIEGIDLKICHDYIRSLSGYSFKTVEQRICGLRHFLRFLHGQNILSEDLALKIHMPSLPKGESVPSVWEPEELKALLAAIDRNSPIGKRDYAMILVAATLGLRGGDIKNLRFSNFNWERKELSIVQHKTKKPLTLPVPDAVCWAIIDYIKNGRPKFYETDIVFVKHMPPFDPFSENNHLDQIIRFYARKAGIDLRGKKGRGFHSLRHTLGSLLLEKETPLPVITQILGHSDSDITAHYLKVDLDKLSECVLNVEGLL